MSLPAEVLAPLRRLLLVLAFAAFVIAGAILGALRAVLRAPLVALHGWLGRLLAALLIALLVAGCGAPRSRAHYAGIFAGEGIPDLPVRMTGEYHSTSDWGERWTWSAEGTEGLLHAPRWEVLDAEGKVLTTARGSANVAIFYPKGATYLRVMLPARVTCFSYTPEGGRVWRAFYGRRIGGG